MARNLVTFIAMIGREGSAGSVRGKIPAGLVKAINAREGDGLQFEVHGTTLVGAKILRGKELRMALKERASYTPQTKTSTTNTKRVAKPTPKATPDVPVRKLKKTVAAPVKPSKRKTVVEYEAPRKLKKQAPKGKPVIKLGRKK